MLFKKYTAKILVSMTLFLSTIIYAEILVILPETGPMANASESIKRGLLLVNKQAGNKYNFKFVDVAQDSVSSILKKNVKKTTQMVIGPLDKQNVEELIALQPNIKTLALNQVDGTAKNVYEFALSKEEDALTLTQHMQKEGINSLIVLRDPNAIQQTQSFYDVMSELWGDKMQVKEKLPFFSKSQQGILLLGTGKWLSQQNPPKKHVYTLPFAIEEQYILPEGVVYCDTPAQYTLQWSDVLEAYKQKPVSIPFQRLIAFGGDTWQIADALQMRKANENIEFQGRTGHIRIVDNVISRTPQCFKIGKSSKMNLS